MLQQTYDIMDRDMFFDDYVELSRLIKNTEARLEAYYIRPDLGYDEIQSINAETEIVYMLDGTCYPIDEFGYMSDYDGDGNKFVIRFWPYGD